MDKHNDPTTTTSPTSCDCGQAVTVNTRGHAIGCNYEWQNAFPLVGVVVAPFVAPWRRRSLAAAGNDPFVAVTDMTDRVAGR